MNVGSLPDDQSTEAGCPSVVNVMAIVTACAKLVPGATCADASPS